MIKPLITHGNRANRRYHVHRQLRKHGLSVSVKQRTIYSKIPPQGRVKQWCAELQQYSYQVQLTIN